MSSYITTRDNVSIYYKDWGAGRPIVMSHGWPLNADRWDDQALHLASNGFRVITHDRRGHGRSSQPWDGNNLDTYADDLHDLLAALDLQDVLLVGFSTGGGEVARYIGRHGSARITKIALVSAITPLMLKTPKNPNGTPMDVFNGLRSASLKNRGELYRNLASGPFFGFNRPGAETNQALVDRFWLQGMMVGAKNAYDCITAFSETDLTQDLKKFDQPTLIIHGDDDQIVPINAAARAAAKLVKGAVLKEYADAPHGLADTHKAQLNEDLLTFARS